MKSAARNVMAAVASLLMLLAPLCICFQPSLTTAQGHCEGMPAEDGQSSTPPTCCTLSTAAHPVLPTAIHSDAPLTAVLALIGAPEPEAAERHEKIVLSLVPQSPPHCNSILRV